jgi:hypothetical protein
MLKVHSMTKHVIEAPKGAVSQHLAAKINELIKTRKLPTLLGVTVLKLTHKQR